MSSKERTAKDDADKQKLIEALKKEREKVLKVQDAYWQEVNAMQAKEKEWNAAEKAAKEKISDLTDEYFKMEINLKNSRMELETAKKAHAQP